ncbi:hypothetical protein L6452_35715 [Arctium lappa]|uniref:Uncharacterized protein n=1 Tax=Arctium lappa TaxID=4217 RepID=A0ACB8Y7A6_ARCLA|nr:hypothetical protein L6452_35715 [Arctium lappa]
MAALSSSSSATNIMLAIHEKKTVSVDLYRPLRNYIVFNYSEREAQNLEDDLETLKEMRNNIERSSTADSLSARCDLLQNYFKAPTTVESSWSGKKRNLRPSECANLERQSPVLRRMSRLVPVAVIRRVDGGWRSAMTCINDDHWTPCMMSKSSM